VSVGYHGRDLEHVYIKRRLGLDLRHALIIGLLSAWKGVQKTEDIGGK